MNVLDLQKWINNKIKTYHLNVPLLKEDGVGGTLTKASFIQIFVNKQAKAATEAEILEAARLLGDSSTKKIKAISIVESGGSGWWNNGLPKILYERHYFYRLVPSNIKSMVTWFINKIPGGYTSDENKNGVNDSWEKLADAAMVNPDAALQSISMSKFQLMGAHYKVLGYNHPIDMLWDVSQNEGVHYILLAKFIKAYGLVPAYNQLSTNPEACRQLAKGYNGPMYEKYNYHIKLAKAMKETS